MMKHKVRHLGLLIRFLRATALIWSSIGAVQMALAQAQVVAGEDWLQRVEVPTHLRGPAGDDTDVGSVPASQMMTLTVRLRPPAARLEALDELIAGQMTIGSASYRQWVTPEEFGARFGAADQDIAAVTAWLESSGMSVSGVSPSRLRLTVTGSSVQVAAAFGVQLRLYRSETGAGYFANAGGASAPEAVGPLIEGVAGLDDSPLARPIAIAGDGTAGEAKTDFLVGLEALVDTNVTAIVSAESAACVSDFAAADFSGYRSVLRQAAAQGITVLAAAGCGAKSFPAGLAEVTAVAGPAVAEGAGANAGIPPLSLHSGQGQNDYSHRGTQDNGSYDGGLAGGRTVAKEIRPAWQFAEGLPEDGLRAAPDVTADAAELAETLKEISQKAGTRLGLVAPVLYALAKTPGLFAQPDAAAAGTWERATGLGAVNLGMLANVYPRGLVGTSSLLTVSNYAPTHGASLTLTATVTSTGGSGVPTGMVTFTSTQKGTLGTAMLNSAGVATFTTDALQAGTYTTTSVYAGDANYLGSTSGVATITVLGEVSLITAAIAPGAAVGGDATINVTVTAGSGVGTPGGTVTVAPQGTSNPAAATATLVGTDGTATATVLLPVYQAGQFTLLISCTDPDPSYTCYSPISIEMVVAKGATVTTLVETPSSPAVGDAYTLTATVSAAGASSAESKTLSPMSVNVARTKAAKGRSAVMKPQDATTNTTTAPTGNMQFMDGNNFLASMAIANGTATYSGTYTAGTHSFEAIYEGDQNYDVSNSNATVTTPTGTTPTATSLTASSYAISVGQTVTFYSTVSPVGVAQTPTGTVTYTAAGQGVLGTGPVLGGLASLSLNSLAAGTYNVTATYSGDSVFAGSSSTTNVAITVAALATATTLTSNVASVLAGQQVTLTATVVGTLAAASATAAPSGTVDFYDSFDGVVSKLGGSPLGSEVAGAAVAVFNTTTLQPGSHSVYAVYEGDLNYLSSTSAAITLGSTNFTITFVPATLTMTRGQSAMATLVVNYQGGFAGTVSFGCTPPPNVELTCSFSPAVIAGSGTVTLNVQTVAPSAVAGPQQAALRQPNAGGRAGRLGAEAILALLAMTGVRRRSFPRVRLALLLGLLAAGALGVTGCSGSPAGNGSQASNDPGSPLGTQILTITTAGSDGTNTVRHDFQYQVTVQ